MNDKVSKIEDQLLVMAAQDGKAKAMEELVRRWQQQLWRYVARIIQDSDGAWDVTQQCWLDIIKGLNKLNDPGSFKAWAYRIATNKSMDWLNARYKNSSVNIDSLEVSCSSDNDEQGIKELLSKLKDQSRTVLGLYYFEKFTVGEISVVLNVPQGTVKSRLFKARVELKQLWEKYFGD